MILALLAIIVSTVVFAAFAYDALKDHRWVEALVFSAAAGMFLVASVFTWRLVELLDVMEAVGAR